MINSIPLQSVPSQTLDIQLNSQNCRLNVYQKGTNVFFDLYSNNGLVVAGVIGRDRTRMVRDAYFGFIGDFSLSWTAKALMTRSMLA